MNSLFGPLDDVAGDAGHVDHPPRVGFFTDTSVCIGCKACEVACKQWNGVPAAEHLDLLGMSHDNTGALGANAWRHVAFVEQSKPVDLGMPAVDGPPNPHLAIAILETECAEIIRDARRAYVTVV